MLVIRNRNIMKLFQHKHKFLCRKEIQFRWDETQSEFEKNQYQWNESITDNQKGYVVLDCTCKNCEVAGKSLAFPVSKVIEYFSGNHQALERLLSQQMSPFEESITRNSKEYWERIIEISSKK